MGRAMHLSRSRSTGFTLVELLVTLAVFAILIALALPSMQQIVASQRVRSVASDIASDLVIARNEAVKRGDNVQLAPSTSGWTGGWTLKVVSSAELLSSRNGTGSGVTFAASPLTVTYDKYGRLSGATSVVRFSINSGSANQRCVSVDPSGRPKSMSSACPT